MVFRGFLATTFETRQQKHHKKHNAHSPEKMDTWAIKLLMLFQAQAHTVLKERNDLNNKTTEFKVTQKQRDTIEAQVRAIYGQQDQVN